jgi:hypothetical protein
LRRVFEGTLKVAWKRYLKRYLKVTWKRYLKITWKKYLFYREYRGDFDSGIVSQVLIV